MRKPAQPFSEDERRRRQHEHHHSGKTGQSQSKPWIRSDAGIAVAVAVHLCEGHWAGFSGGGLDGNGISGGGL